MHMILLQHLGKSCGVELLYLLFIPNLCCTWRHSNLWIFYAPEPNSKSQWWTHVVHCVACGHKSNNIYFKPSVSLVFCYDRQWRSFSQPTGAMATPKLLWTPLVIVIWLDKNQRLPLLFNGWPLLGLDPSSTTDDRCKELCNVVSLVM
jgi:hypothetical protein